jgi:hypothetical protein
MTIPECFCAFCPACWPRPYRYSIIHYSRRGTMQLHTLLGMEAVDMHMHCICTFWGLFVSRFYVGMKWIWGVLYLFRWGVLFYSYVGVVYLLYIMTLTSLWKFCWINNLITYLLFIIMTCTLLWLNWCLIIL